MIVNFFIACFYSFMISGTTTLSGSIASMDMCVRHFREASGQCVFVCLITLACSLCRNPEELAACYSIFGLCVSIIEVLY